MRKWLVFTFVSFVLALAIAAAFFFRATLSVSTNLSLAVISVDKRTVSGSGIFRLLSGKHAVKISAAGYIPYEKEHRLGLGQRETISVELRAIPEAIYVWDQETPFLALSSDKSSVFFISPTGQLLGRTKDDLRPLTPEGAFRNLVSMSLSPEQDVAIYKTTDGATRLYDFKRYDLVAQEHFVFGSGIGAINWVLPSGEKLIYSFAPGTGEKSLILANRTNADQERILNLAEQELDDPTIATSPDGKVAVLVSRPGTDYPKYDLLLFDFFTKTPAKITSDGHKIDATFSPGGRRLLFTRFRQDPQGKLNHLLSTADSDGKNRKDFEIRTTLSKIAFLDDDRLIIASPSDVGDRLIQLNLRDGTQTEYYFSTDRPMYLGSLQLSKDQKTLFAIASETDPKAQSGQVMAIPLESAEY